jgi:hypothetical protein
MLNRIYAKELRMSYVYLLRWKLTGVWYYGRRTAPGCSPKEFWVSYFTSSKYVKKYIEEHGQPDIMQIRKTFNDIKECENWEHRFLLKTNAPMNKFSLNRSYATAKMNSTGMAPAKNYLTSERLGLISLDDPRWKTGEIVGVFKDIKNEKIKKLKENTVQAKDLTGKFLGNVHKTDPRWKTGEIVHIRQGETQDQKSRIKNKLSNQNRITIITPEGQILKIYNDHPLYLDGTYKGISAGRVWVNNGINNKTIEKSKLDIFISDGWFRGRIKK